MYATEKRAVGTGISGIRGLYGWVNLLPTIVGKIFIQVFEAIFTKWREESLSSRAEERELCKSLARDKGAALKS